MIDLKVSILKRLQSHLANKRLNIRHAYESLSFNIGQINLSELLHYLGEDFPYAYWKNRENTNEVLALGSNKTFNKLSDWKRIEELTHENPDLIFVGGQRFSQDGVRGDEWSSFGDMFYLLPMLVLEKKDQNFKLKVFFPADIVFDSNLKAGFLLKIEELLNWQNDSDFMPLNYETEQVPNKEVWEQNIDEHIEQLENNSLKVVLARKLIQTSATELSPAQILNDAKNNAKESFLFLLRVSNNQAFLSLTPERLFKVKDDQISTDALAGTRPRGQDLESDQQLGKELLQSEKELNEHRIVGEEIEEKLSQFCKHGSVEKTKNEELLKLKFVQHIHSHYQGKLDKNVSINSMIETLHPTPAVGGRPWHIAKEIISIREEFDRGFYAGPIGVISSEETDFAVGIRSALINKNELHLYSGAGIVKGSKGKDEWIETQNKLKNFPIQL